MQYTVRFLAVQGIQGQPPQLRLRRRQPVRVGCAIMARRELPPRRMHRRTLHFRQIDAVERHGHVVPRYDGRAGVGQSAPTTARGRGGGIVR